MKPLTHLDALGRVQMVDISEKAETLRVAIARGVIRLQPETLRLIQEGAVPKGDVFATAKVAGIMAAKAVPTLIPLCHPLLISAAEITFRPLDGKIEIEACVKTVGKTGAEMEALTAVAVAALTIYDMCKGVDKEMVLEQIRLVAKEGGRSGRYLRPGEEIGPSGEASP